MCSMLDSKQDVIKKCHALEALAIMIQVQGQWFWCHPMTTYTKDEVTSNKILCPKLLAKVELQVGSQRQPDEKTDQSMQPFIQINTGNKNLN